eukprot:gene23048-biopygen31657
MQNSLDVQLSQLSRRGDVNGVVSILEQGANVNSTDSWTLSTPLFGAALDGYEECIEALLDCGADVNSKDRNGSTPLHKAAYKGHVECIKALLVRGADVNIKDYFGSTPLHEASYKGHMECVKALLGRGADVGIKDIEGLSALDLALRLGGHDVVDAVRNHMRRRSDAQHDGDQRPASQSSSRNLQTEKRELSTLQAAARSRVDDCEEQLIISKSRNDEHKAQLAIARSEINEYKEQLATARSRIDECEVHMACMTGQGDVLAPQDVETLERLLAKVDKECLRKAIFDKYVQRERHQALDAAAECGVCLSAPKDTTLNPCGHTMCRSCSDRIQVCPICCQNIAERRRVFL